jgi:NitT/TauT family transport system ATP-binding protein
VENETKAPTATRGSMDLSGQPVVRLDDVQIAYDSGTVAVEGLSLEIPRGKVVGIVGPSGCGKSTLLYALAGLMKPSQGRILRAPAPGGTHPLTLMFQKDTLLPWLTVRENVAIFYRWHGRRHRRAEVRERVQELLARVGLGGFEDAYPYQLSGGMRRRVAFLAAVAPNPACLLLDEPFSSLDEPTRVAVQQDVLRIIYRSNMTCVLVTHDLAEAVTMCDDVYILTRRPGRVFTHHEVPFGKDRTVVEMRQDPTFLSLYGTLWHELSQQLGQNQEVETVA